MLLASRRDVMHDQGQALGVWRYLVPCDGRRKSSPITGELFRQLTALGDRRAFQDKTVGRGHTQRLVGGVDVDAIWWRWSAMTQGPDADPSQDHGKSAKEFEFSRHALPSRKACASCGELIADCCYRGGGNIVRGGFDCVIRASPGRQGFPGLVSTMNACDCACGRVTRYGYGQDAPTMLDSARDRGARLL